MVIFFSWETIGFLIIIILLFLGGSDNIYGIVTFILSISKILAVIGGVIHFLACWLSERLFCTKVWNSFCISFFVYALYWGTGYYREELISVHEVHPIRYLFLLIFGGIEFLLYMALGSSAIMSLSKEEGDTPHISLITSVSFLGFIIEWNNTLLSDTMDKIGTIGMTGIKIILICSVFVTIIQKLFIIRKKRHNNN